MKALANPKFFAALAAGVFAFSAQAAEKLPTDYGDPANDLKSGSIEGLTWTGAARAYKIENDVVLVFTDTSENCCSFTLADGYRAQGRYLLVGGGGPGGYNSDNSRVAGGGGAGGMKDTASVLFASGNYQITIGVGGAIAADKNSVSQCGGDTVLTFGGIDFCRVKGGGAGGSAADGDKAAGNPQPGGSGGGAAVYYHEWAVKGGNGGAGTEGQGHDGGAYTGSTLSLAGGGGGAGSAGELGSGGAGLVSDITGEEVTYAGGGASGAWRNSQGSTLLSGGVGGGSSTVTIKSTFEETIITAGSGVDGLGGGGAGGSGMQGFDTGTSCLPGRGGNGVAVVRLSKVEKPTPVEGFTFSGETEWFNIGEGDEKETVVVFKDAEAECSFTLARNANARILVVGGGGPGGNANQGQMVGGGGAGGGVVDATYADYYAGSYTVKVGKGGVANGDYDNPAFNNNGAPSFIMRGETEVLRALGGGGGGVPNNSGNKKVACGNPYGYCTSDDDKSYDFTKVDVANGGGAAFAGTYARHPGKVGDLGYEGGSAWVVSESDFTQELNAGGGAGAGENGHNAAGQGQSGAGGNGKVSDITGEEVYYGGGGAGGTFGTGSGVTALVSGGLGGGGSAYVDDSQSAHVFAGNGVDGLGGGGAGSSLSAGTSPRTKAVAGRGGDGVVIVRVKKVYPAEEPLDGVSFTGAAEWFNLGHGKTRETVIVYTNVNETGTLTLSRRAIARVLLVGGGGAGGYEGAGNLVGAGGGAGGFVETNEVALKRGVYSIVVGKGGEPNGNKDSGDANPNGNGTESKLIDSQAELFCALGGGAGGIANGNQRWNLAAGRNGGSGGGAGVCLTESGTPGSGTEGQGNSGGKANGSYTYRAAGGGGGAGTRAADAPSSTTSSAGGDGRVSDITGTGVWYAGGGAGGAWSNAVGEKTIAGGKGGGGKSFIHIGNVSTDVWQTAYAGEDGTGGGGAGSAGIDGAHGLNVGSPAGRGGNGVVIVRITEVLPQGLSVNVR